MKMLSAKREEEDMRRKNRFGTTEVSNMESKESFSIDHYCSEHYRQAVFTAVFSFVKGYGELMFASLEFVPKFMGACCGIDDEQMAKVGERRMYFTRHVIDDVLQALDMYRQMTRTGQVQMPWQKGPPLNMIPYSQEPTLSADGAICLEELNSGDSKTEPLLVYFPRLEEPFYIDNPPFRSSTFSGALVSHVMLKDRNRGLENFLSDKAISQWIEDRLMWPLNENLEYIGSFSCIFPNPYYCRSRMRLVPRTNGGKDSVRVVFDRDCSSQGLSLQLQERVSFNLGPVREIPIDSRVVEVELTGCSDEVGYRVLDKNGQILEHHDFAPFIRGINVDFSIIKPRKSKKYLGGGKVLLSSSGLRIPGSHMKCVKEPELELQHKRAVFRFAREARDKAKFQYLYFSQRKEAERRIWGIITSARESITIIDPYFSDASIEDFIEDLDGRIEVSVCCSSGALKSNESNAPGKRLLEKVERLVQGGRKITVDVAGHSYIHDRFIIVDKHEAWLLGSSVATLGDSLSAIIKLENGGEVSDVLLEHIKKMPGRQSLKKWLEKSDQERKRQAKLGNISKCHDN